MWQQTAPAKWRPDSSPATAAAVAWSSSRMPSLISPPATRASPVSESASISRSMTPERRPMSSAALGVLGRAAGIAVGDQRDLALQEREPALLLAVVVSPSSRCA